MFRVIYLSLTARLFGGARRPGTENQNHIEFTCWPCLFTEIYALPRAAAQIAQEKQMRRKTGLDAVVPRDQKSTKIWSYFSLFGCLAAQWNVKTRGGDLFFFQNLYVTCGLKILIVHRASRASLYIVWSLVAVGSGPTLKENIIS